MPDGLTKGLDVGRVTDSLQATTDRDAWKDMVASEKKKNRACE